MGAGASTIAGASPAALSIVTVYSFESVLPAASVTTTVITKSPACVGVPDNTPPLNVKPGGSPDVAASCWLYGPVPPDGVSVCGYGTPTRPGGSTSGVSASG